MDHPKARIPRRGLLAAGLGAAAAVAVAGTQFAGRPRPATAAGNFDFIIGCDDWGARPPSSTLTMSHNVTNKIIVHHMAFPNSTDYSEAHAKQLARDCQDLHMDTNGWADTGQHFTVSRGGYVLEGRHRSLEGLEGGEHQVIAAHCPGENGNAIGIENEGTYVTQTPPQAQLDALAKLCVTICTQYGLHAHDMFGHWDFRDTDCPGIAFYKEFPKLRRAVRDGLGTAAGDIPARRWPDVWRFVGGPVVELTQYLLNERGYGVAANGTWGDDTTAAIQDWQSSHGIPVDPDGTMTGPTWESMAPDLDTSASGPAVQGIQYILGHKGYDVSETGTYDSATGAAVKAIQKLHGLSATGTVDASTWCAISGGIVKQEFEASAHGHGHGHGADR